MTSSNLQIQEISAMEFKTYLQSKRDNNKWFYWHFNSSLINFRTFNIVHQRNIVGVICYEKTNLPKVDLYIDKPFRRLGYGKCVAKYISGILKTVQFQVNSNNEKSIKFFESLLSNNIVTSKVINRGI